VVAARHKRRRVIMHRFARLVSVVTVLLLGMLALHGHLVATAQEATPPAGEMASAGVTFEPVTIAPGVDLDTPADLMVDRLSFEPGAAVTFDETDPGAGILLVESGTFTLQIAGPVTVTRGAGLGEAMATAEASGDMSGLIESVAADQVVTLQAGDAAYIPGYTAGEIRNEGQEPATALGFLVFPSEGMTGEATPTP